MHMFTYDSQGSNSYLVYQITEEDVIDSLSLGMMTHNSIEGLVPVLYQRIDEVQVLKYNISSRITLSQFFADTVNRRQMLGVLSGITGALLKVEEYMIDPRMLLLENDYIFVDVSSCRAAMICLPLQSVAPDAGDINEKMSRFLKDMIFRTQFDQTENLDYVAQIISFINRPQAFALSDFRDFLNQLSGRAPLAPKGPEAPSQAVVPPQAPPSYGAPPMTLGGSGPQAAPMPPAPFGPTGHRTPQMPPSSPVSQVPPGAPAAPSYPQPPAQCPAAGGHKKPLMPPSPVPAQRPVQVSSPQPFAQPSASPGTPDQAVSGSSGKKMSLAYLLMHYSKENKAIYDAQKQQQAGVPPQAVPAGTPPGTPSAKPKGRRGAAPQGGCVPQSAPGVPQSVPGAPSSPFAIPGAPPEPPGGFRSAPPAQAAPPAPQKAVGGRRSAPQSPPVPPGAPTYVTPGQPGRGQGYPAPPPPMQPSTPVLPPVMAPPQQGPVNFGETTALSGGRPGETTVLMGARQPSVPANPYLVRKSNNERIPIDKPFFRIGKEKSFVDYFIGDNSAISRSHANIVLRDGKNYIVDTNSTNHTFVNGQMIPVNAEIPLRHGDQVRLADENFEFFER